MACTTKKDWNSRAWRTRPGAWIAMLTCGAMLTINPGSSAQIKDEVRIYAQDASNGGAESVVRFSRKLVLLGVTSTKGLSGTLGYGTPLAVDGQGRSWIAFDPLNTTKLLRIDNSGVLLPSALLSNNPVNVVIDVDGRAYASTRIGLSSPGPVYGVAPDGSVLWRNISGPALYNYGYPQQLALTGTGELWLGDGIQSGGNFMPLMVRLDKSTGAVAETLTLAEGSGVCAFAPSGDGTLWAFSCGVVTDGWLFKTQGTQVLGSFHINGGYNGTANTVHVDAHDRPHVLSLATDGWGSKIYRYNPAAPATPDAVFQFGGNIQNWVFGPSGEEIFAVIGPAAAPLTRRLERVNLFTGTKSSIPLDPVWPDGDLSAGDHTGFTYANVIDRNGDNDGDGAPNGVETAAGSDPFDPLSRPDGPKVYIKFVPVTNALELAFEDPDGLIDPQGGLDVSTLSLSIGHYNNVFNYLLPFVTGIDVSPDFKQATLTFGGLPLPIDKKWQVAVSVADLTGAMGWDWQVTPPGDL